MSQRSTLSSEPDELPHAEADSPIAADQAPGAFGPRMAKYLSGPNQESLDVEWFAHSDFVVTRLQYSKGLSSVSAPIPSERAFIINVQLIPIPFHQLWLRGALAQTGCLSKGAVGVLDLEQGPRFFLPTEFDALQFYVRREKLDHYAHGLGAERTGALSWQYGAVDETLLHLSLILIKLLKDRKHKLIVDQLVKMLMLHFLFAYGAPFARTGGARGGLASWQLRRCKDRMSHNLASSISVSELAKDCRLSRVHFSRSFKRSTGETPHRWLLRRRVEEVKKMLAATEVPISEIALACGFNDQSHLTKAFSAIAGLTPGAWRREQKN